MFNSALTLPAALSKYEINRKNSVHNNDALQEFSMQMLYDQKKLPENPLSCDIHRGNQDIKKLFRS